MRGRDVIVQYRLGCVLHIDLDVSCTFWLTQPQSNIQAVTDIRLQGLSDAESGRTDFASCCYSIPLFLSDCQFHSLLDDQRPLHALAGRLVVVRGTVEGVRAWLGRLE